MLEISYSGSLNVFEPKKKRNVFIGFLKDFFWTYNNDNIDASTRSGYFLIKAVSSLKEKNAITPKQLKISLWGDIHPGNIQQIKENKVEEYFSVGGYLPKEESLKKLMDSDVLFLPLEKSNCKEHRTLFIPGKLFEYLNSGKPILALCEDSDCKDILETSGLGICIAPDNIASIADSLLNLILHPDALKQYQPNKSFIDGFSFKQKAMELAEVFNQLIAENAGK